MSHGLLAHMYVCLYVLVDSDSQTDEYLCTYVGVYFE